MAWDKLHGDMINSDMDWGATPTEGVLCLPVNSSEEGKKRRARGSIVSELEPGFFLGRDGVTRRYFAREGLKNL